MSFRFNQADLHALSSSRRLLTRISCSIVLAASLAGCNSTSDALKVAAKTANINNDTKFSSKVFGVAASPRLTVSTNVKKGGGRAVVGKPYKVRGKWYHPKEEPGYDRSGLASWYGPNFHGRLTANGEIYDQNHLSAAHPTFPLPSYARVTHKESGRSVVVRVNDRGPFAHNRIIDLSSKAADMLGTKQKGVADVRVEYIGRAPLHGQDMQYLVASYSENGRPGIFSQGTQIAVNAVKAPFEIFKSSPKPARAPRRDLLTLIGGKNVYVPTADVTGSIPSSDTPAPQLPATKTPKVAVKKAKPKTVRNAKTVKPTVLATVLETDKPTTIVKPKLTADLLKKYHLRKSLQ